VCKSCINIAVRDTLIEGNDYGLPVDNSTWTSSGDALDNVNFESTEFLTNDMPGPTHSKVLQVNSTGGAKLVVKNLVFRSTKWQLSGGVTFPVELNIPSMGTYSVFSLKLDTNSIEGANTAVVDSDNALASIFFTGESDITEPDGITRPADVNVLIPAVRDTIGSVNRSASLQFTTLKQQADDSVLQEDLMAVLSGFFGGLALLLTAVGLYGVMAYAVTQRTHEIGIRMALGAQQTSILRLVMRDGAIVLVAGVAAGLLRSIWITRLVKRLLFGLTPSDPGTMALAIAAMVMVAFVATHIPARDARRL
jgi:ABC-type antimicrobial peptide transport system permease subunit